MQLEISTGSVDVVILGRRNSRTITAVARCLIGTPVWPGAGK